MRVNNYNSRLRTLLELINFSRNFATQNAVVKLKGKCYLIDGLLGIQNKNNLALRLIAMKNTSEIEEIISRVVSDLFSLNIDFALIGGFAVTLRAEPRLTKDLDFAVFVKTDEQAEKIVHQFINLSYKIITVIENKDTSRLATVRMQSPYEKKTNFIIDLLFSSSGIEPEIIRDAEELKLLNRIKIPVASAEALFAMKLLARNDRLRPQDYDDLQALYKSSPNLDLKQIKSYLTLIKKRGYSRKKKDLIKEMQKIVSKFRKSY